MDAATQAILQGLEAISEHQVTSNADGTFRHTWTFAAAPRHFPGFTTVETEAELQMLLLEQRFDRQYAPWLRAQQEGA